MTLAQAKQQIMDGAKFGDVYPLLPHDAAPSLRHWFVTEPTVPVVRDAAPGPAAAPKTGTAMLEKSQAIRQAKSMGYTGNPCGVCGSMMVTRNGSCEKCETCGTTSGCS